jgi:hypothetical protein
VTAAGVIFAFGYILTVMVKPADVHPSGTFGVTKYVAVPTVVVELDNVPDTIDEAELKAPPVIPPVTFGALQL